MNMGEVVTEVSFMLGMPSNSPVEAQQIERAVLIAFRELKRYMRTSVEKTVPFSTRINLLDNNIITSEVLNVQAAYPRIGLTMTSIDTGNVFQIAASVNMYSSVGNVSRINIDPIVTEAAMAQVRNTLSTDFQWKYDIHNQVVYCTHRDPQPTAVTIRYIPNYEDVSEILNPTYQDYLVRMATANMKVSLGRARSKYKVESSNVSLDGEILLQEGNEELSAIRAELKDKKNRLIVMN